MNRIHWIEYVLLAAIVACIGVISYQVGDLAVQAKTHPGTQQETCK